MSSRSLGQQAVIGQAASAGATRAVKQQRPWPLAQLASNALDSWRHVGGWKIVTYKSVAAHGQVVDCAVIPISAVV